MAWGFRFLVGDDSPVSSRRGAVVTCAFCDWSARHTDDTAVAVAHFLRRLLLEHVAREHPDRIDEEPQG